MIVDEDSGNALSLTDDRLEIGKTVNLTPENQDDTKQKWVLSKDRRTGWMKLKKPNGFFLESSECGKDLIIQGIHFILKCQHNRKCLLRNLLEPQVYIQLVYRPHFRT